MKDIGQIRAKACMYLSRREYCQREMVKKLISKGADQKMAEEVAEVLGRSGLISDERFTQEFIRVRVRQGYGPIRIEHELIQRGVAEHLASACLSEWNTSWTEQLERVIERKYKNDPVSSFKEWAKRANFLKMRGFTAEQIRGKLGQFRN